MRLDIDNCVAQNPARNAPMLLPNDRACSNLTKRLRHSGGQQLVVRVAD